MGKIKEILTGYKTYLVCVSAILLAIIGYTEGTLTLAEAITAIIAALAGMTGSAKLNRLIGVLKDLNKK